MLKANFQMIGGEQDGKITIADVGPWDKHRTVTNDIENVIERLIDYGSLTPGVRLMYYDSEGQLGEVILTKEIRFSGFWSYIPLSDSDGTPTVAAPN